MQNIICGNKNRLNIGRHTVMVGMVCNIALFIIKITIGFVTNSIAITTDAINNLSDTGSCGIALLGFSLAAKPADNEHPFGHGRIEYIASVIAAVIILAIGMNFLKDSILRIIHPVSMDIPCSILLIYAGTMLVKAGMYFFYRHQGKKINSQLIQASALDCLSDILSTLIIFLAVIIGKYANLAIDGYIGILAAGLVIYAGVQILIDTINPLLGQLPSSELVESLRNIIISHPGICGVHDIIMHNYGPNQYFATAHAEVSHDGDLLSVHDLLESVEVKVAQSLPVRLVLHCDPYNTGNPVIKEWRAMTENLVTATFDCNFKVYDFWMDPNKQGQIVLNFNLLIPRNYCLSENEIQDKLTAAICAKSGKDVKLVIKFQNAFVDI